MHKVLCCPERVTSLIVNYGGIMVLIAKGCNEFMQTVGKTTKTITDNEYKIAA